MLGIIDRFEGNMAVVEIEGRTKDYPIDQVERAARPGDVVKLIDGIWVKDIELTKKRTVHINKLAEALWEED